MNVFAVFVGVLLCCELVQEPSTPPLSDAQRAQITQIAKNADQTSSRLAAQLIERQRALAELYSSYQLDLDQATKIEAEILELQRQRLANYRELQVQLRAIVSEERFRSLKKRLDNLLQSAGRDSAIAGAPEQPPKELPAAARKVEPIYSGPQSGEKLPPFVVRGVFDAAAGQELNFVNQADGKPIVLVFVHEANRPSIGFTRVLTTYTSSLAKDGLSTGVVWLADDVIEAESTLKRMRQALAPAAPVGISIDGREGPGNYGLNRNVTLTIIVGNKNQVIASFALVQPSIQADLPKILEAIAKVTGGPPPKLEDLPGVRDMMQPPARAGQAEPDPRLRGLIAPVIQLNASEEAVDRAASAVEEFVRANASARGEVGRIARTIVESGRLDSYGTPRAREYLRKWAKDFGGLQPSADPPARPLDAEKKQ